MDPLVVGGSEDIFRGRPRFFGGAGSPSAPSLADLPRFLGRLVPGGAVRFTVQ